MTVIWDFIILNIYVKIISNELTIAIRKEILTRIFKFLLFN
jgi:hypothetical protein